MWWVFRHVQVGVIGYHPGVWCRDRTLINKNVPSWPDDLLRGDWNDTESSVPVGASATLLCDPGCPITDDMSSMGRDLRF